MNYQTRDGIPIVMRRAKYIEAPGYDRGWITHRVIAEIDGKKVGHVSITWIPDFDDRYADLGAYIKAFHRYEDVEREREKTRAFHGEPFICGVHVEPEYRRRGIAIAMYQEGARWLADEWNLRLRSGETRMNFPRPCGPNYEPSANLSSRLMWSVVQD